MLTENEITNVFKTKLIFDDIHSFLEKISDIDYCIIKGEPLSLLAYGSLGKRFYNDIDILTSIDNLMFVEECLCKSDFKKKQQSRSDRILTISGSHQVSPYTKQMCNYSVSVDLNFDIFWGEYTGKRVKIVEFLSDKIEIDIYGIKVKTLPPLKALVQLILHHYKEMNSIYHLAGHNSINFRMFKDIYYLVNNNQETISLDKLYDISSKYEIIPYVFYVLYFTSQVFDNVDLKKYVEAFKTSEGVNLLDYYGLTEKECKPWKVDFKTRLENENMYELIKNDLTEADLEKFERNRRIFG